MHKLKLVTYASTLLLVAGIASATDLNNINKINPDSDGKVEFGGFIDMNSNSISEVGTPQDADDAAPRSWINDNDDVIPDTTVPDDQNVQVSSSGDTISVSIDNGNGGSATIDDNTIADDQSLSVNNDGGAGTNDIISLDNGGSIEIDDDFEANTDNQNINSFSASGDTVTLNLENGGSASATITDNVQDADSSPTNELQDLEDVRSRSNNVNGNINFQSSGSIVSLENLNVDSINSNKGSDPVDLDQGADVEAALMIPVGPDSYY